MTNNGQAADLLRNDGGNRGSAILIRLIGKRSNRDGIGAKLQIKTGTTTHVRYVKAGSSYLGQNDMRVHVGVGDATLIDRLEVRWPSGQVDTATRVPVNSVVTVVEGEGVSRRMPFVAKR